MPETPGDRLKKYLFGTPGTTTNQQPARSILKTPGSTGRTPGRPQSVTFRRVSPNSPPGMFIMGKYSHMNLSLPYHDKKLNKIKSSNHLHLFIQ